ncbi:MAG: metalloprotease family protein [Oryzomonas sp.]|uniref:metalloprotease family protein n=1 Tax=Oryzomonas sp. TaxID=2855186 RepID=UPI00283BC4A6|nr:metalloprotease family protein [Oryzomonas sp.]MDR3580738.1 metalloprotease family protein [Oryzomonas sp.]
MTARLIVSLLTFPGVVLHEYAHAWACRRLGIRVLKICYLRLGNPLGYVLHEQPQYAVQHIMVAVAPFFVSTATALAVSLLTSLVAASPTAAEFRDLAVLVGAWLSFSMALHAFPSSGDGDALWQDVTSPDVSFFAKLLLAPVVGLIRLSQAGAAVWFHALFAVGVVALPPVMLVTIMG